ncbi:MAG TPA: neutral zinc metallopeptidase [Devosiaceae bacterium]
MRWRGRERSSNIEDRRSAGGGFGRMGGMGGAGPRIRIGRGGGIGGLALVLGIVVVSMMLGIDPSQILSGDLSGLRTGGTIARPAPSAGDDELAAFVSVVVKDTEDTWGAVFSQNSLTYTPPKVVLFSGTTSAACGVASASTGPFYCPADRKVYIDLSFYDQLRRQFGAPGDFAEAYVLAHEIGHHVQNLIGVLPAFNKARAGMSKTEANAYSVRVELQADCYAGVWAHSANAEGLLEKGDLEEALNAASRIGDDTLQKQAQGYAVPDSFTHGTSAQRVKWFRVGYANGNPGACDTFSGSD